MGRSAALPPVRRVHLNQEVSALAWGDSPAHVVLLHGVALNAHTWDATLLAWPDPATRFSFLAIDLPGHGESPWRTDADYSPATLASVIVEALRAAIRAGLVSPSPKLVGHSLGGLAGLEILRTQALELSQLLLVDILPLPASAARVVAEFLNGPRSFGSREEIVQRAAAFGFGGALDSLRRGVFHNTRIAADGRASWKHHVGQLGGDAFVVAEAESVWPVIETSAVPIDLVVATRSIVDEAAVQRFGQARPGANVRRVEGGHNLQEDNPMVLARCIAELL